jgi:hypothetical protein
VDQVDEILNVDGVPDEQLLADLKDMIRLADSEKPRSQQVALGPSEVGHPCARKLAYGLTAQRAWAASNAIEPNQRGHNTGSDPLAAIIGTATHSWLEEAAHAANRRLGRTRWLTEIRVEVCPGLSGSCDIYDFDTFTAIDWKVPGAARFKKYTTTGAGPTYKGQRHMYGRGLIRMGLRVDFVANCYIPRAGTLAGTKLQREPYDDDLVTEILARIDTVKGLVEGLSLQSTPEHFALIPITPDSDCAFCPWWSPVPDSGNPYSCAGQQEPK